MFLKTAHFATLAMGKLVKCARINFYKNHYGFQLLIYSTLLTIKPCYWLLQQVLNFLTSAHCRLETKSDFSFLRTTKMCTFSRNFVRRTFAFSRKLSIFPKLFVSFFARKKIKYIFAKIRKRKFAFQP
jgi:hypothetical protein